VIITSHPLNGNEGVCRIRVGDAADLMLYRGVALKWGELLEYKVRGLSWQGSDIISLSQRGKIANLAGYAVVPFLFTWRRRGNG